MGDNRATLQQFEGMGLNQLALGSNSVPATEVLRLGSFPSQSNEAPSSSPDKKILTLEEFSESLSSFSPTQLLTHWRGLRKELRVTPDLAKQVADALVSNFDSLIEPNHGAKPRHLAQSLLQIISAGVQAHPIIDKVIEWYATQPNLRAETKAILIRGLALSGNHPKELAALIKDLAENIHELPSRVKFRMAEIVSNCKLNAKFLAAFSEPENSPLSPRCRLILASYEMLIKGHYTEDFEKAYCERDLELRDVPTGSLLMLTRNELQYANRPFRGRLINEALHRGARENNYGCAESLLKIAADSIDLGSDRRLEIRPRNMMRIIDVIDRHQDTLRPEDAHKLLQYYDALNFKCPPHQRELLRTIVGNESDSSSEVRGITSPKDLEIFVHRLRRLNCYDPAAFSTLMNQIEARRQVSENGVSLAILHTSAQFKHPNYELRERLWTKLLEVTTLDQNQVTELGVIAALENNAHSSKRWNACRVLLRDKFNWEISDKQLLLFSQAGFSLGHLTPEIGTRVSAVLKSANKEVRENAGTSRAEMLISDAMRTAGIPFEPQVPCFGYALDFLAFGPRETKMAIEPGHLWYHGNGGHLEFGSPASDDLRDRALAFFKIPTLRILNHEIPDSPGVDLAEWIWDRINEFEAKYLGLRTD